MDFQFSGKTAFVTGGASGIGLAMCRSFRAQKMNVVIADKNPSALASIANEFAAESSLLLEVDVRSRQALDEAADKAEAKFGAVHVLCNNAGVGASGSIDKASDEQWQTVMDINVNGVINGLQTFVERMIEHGEGGHIVNTASLAGVLPVNAQVIYNTSKYAVVGLSESIRKDLRPHGIGVTVLCPGFVATNIFGDGIASPLSSASSLSASSSHSSLSGGDQALRSDLISQAIDPKLVGIMVVKAISKNMMYLFTHPEFGSFVEKRATRIKQGFDLSEQVLKEAISESAAGTDPKLSR